MSVDFLELVIVHRSPQIRCSAYSAIHFSPAIVATGKALGLFLFVFGAFQCERTHFAPRHPASNPASDILPLQ